MTQSALASRLALFGRAWLGAGIVCAMVAGCEPRDQDGDGFLATSDCDDLNADRAPDQIEICNGVDDDCDGEQDENLATAYYTDADGDGFGDADTVVFACSRPQGAVTTKGDCDDGRIDVKPGAVEVCNGIDDDCDGETDEDTLSVTLYEDNDGDGVGSAPLEGCGGPDAEGVAAGGDCDDTNPTIGPQAPEVCDGVDQNCNGVIDESTDGLATWEDGDGDGYGDPDGFFVACDGDLPAGYVENSADCDDTEGAVFAGAVEVCDDLDNDCDKTVDEDIGLSIYADTDADGFGDPNEVAFSCDIPAGWAANPYDCDDADPLAHTGATEVCDDTDNDCDGDTDEEVAVSWWTDADGDSFGDQATQTDGCVPPAGVVFLGGDCDDSDPDSSPVANEICDFKDNDCDNRIDEGLTVSWWTDADLDGFGDPSAFVVGCEVPANGVQNTDDCDDTRSTVSPAGTEACNLLDDDCDSVVDDGVGIVYWADDDADGVGSTNAGFTRDCTVPAGFAAVAGDCDDGDGTVTTCATDVTGSMPTFGVDAARSGHQAGFLAGGSPADLWSETVTGMTLSAPIVVDGVVYFISNGATDTLHARDATTGAEVWDYTLTSGANAAQPTYNSGRILAYTSDLSNTLAAVDEITGLLSWSRVANGGTDLYRAPLAFNSNVYVGAGTFGGINGYSGATGAPLFTILGPDYDDWTPAGHDGRVWTHVGSNLYGRNTGSGAIEVTVPLASAPLLPTRMSTVPAFAGDTALLIAGDDLVAVDLVTNTVAWTIADGFSGSPSIADGMGYAVHAGSVWQVDLADGFVGQEYIGDFAITGKPLVTDDVVIAGSAGANFVFDVATADILYVIPPGALAVGEGHAVRTSGATVYVQAL